MITKKKILEKELISLKGLLKTQIAQAVETEFTNKKLESSNNELQLKTIALSIENNEQKKKIEQLEARILSEDVNMDTIIKSYFNDFAEFVAEKAAPQIQRRCFLSVGPFTDYIKKLIIDIAKDFINT